MNKFEALERIKNEEEIFFIMSVNDTDIFNEYQSTSFRDSKLHLFYKTNGAIVSENGYNEKKKIVERLEWDLETLEAKITALDVKIFFMEDIARGKGYFNPDFFITPDKHQRIQFLLFYTEDGYEYYLYRDYSGRYDGIIKLKVGGKKLTATLQDSLRSKKAIRMVKESSNQLLRLDLQKDFKVKHVDWDYDRIRSTNSIFCVIWSKRSKKTSIKIAAREISFGDTVYVNTDTTRVEFNAAEHAAVTSIFPSTAGTGFVMTADACDAFKNYDIPKKLFMDGKVKLVSKSAAYGYQYEFYIEGGKYFTVQIIGGDCEKGTTRVKITAYYKADNVIIFGERNTYDYHMDYHTDADPLYFEREKYHRHFEQIHSHHLVEDHVYAIVPNGVLEDLYVGVMYETYLKKVGKFEYVLRSKLEKELSVKFNNRKTFIYDITDIANELDDRNVGRHYINFGLDDKELIVNRVEGRYNLEALYKREQKVLSSIRSNILDRQRDGYLSPLQGDEFESLQNGDIVIEIKNYSPHRYCIIHLVKDKVLEPIFSYPDDSRSEPVKCSYLKIVTKPRKRYFYLATNSIPDVGNGEYSFYKSNNSTDIVYFLCWNKDRSSEFAIVFNKQTEQLRIDNNDNMFVAFKDQELDRIRSHTVIITEKNFKSVDAGVVGELAYTVTKYSIDIKALYVLNVIKPHGVVVGAPGKEIFAQDEDIDHKLYVFEDLEELEEKKQKIIARYEKIQNMKQICNDVYLPIWPEKDKED